MCSVETHLSDVDRKSLQRDDDDDLIGDGEYEHHRHHHPQHPFITEPAQPQTGAFVF